MRSNFPSGQSRDIAGLLESFGPFRQQVTAFCDTNGYSWIREKDKVVEFPSGDAVMFIELRDRASGRTRGGFVGFRCDKEFTRVHNAAFTPAGEDEFTFFTELFNVADGFPARKIPMFPHGF